jgi:hypothetical protein
VFWIKDEQGQFVAVNHLMQADGDGRVPTIAQPQALVRSVEPRGAGFSA